jgi:hypothetical protein
MAAYDGKFVDTIKQRSLSTRIQNWKPQLFQQNLYSKTADCRDIPEATYSQPEC